MERVLSARESVFLRFKRGDEVAFKFYFDKYYNNIVGFCVQFLHDEDKAKSVAQEAFIKLWLNREKVSKKTGIPAFLYTAAKSKCLNQIRHNKVVSKYKDFKLQEKEQQLNQEVLQALNFDSMNLTELKETIDKAIQDLPERCREVFIKRRIENKKNREIAEELGVSVKAVEANMTRAIKELNIKLAHYLSVFL
ncbi:RNA polymerase sigma-70 factor [Snuella sp. CAU 1569]|uniref:RNA polymerase sigma-70 factor n=2 Tax=Snuella sedimenti TaxID=2798802 RepID=A0A8J7J382_9FLAO|nr:RNA polymerase sigma-70 factor [Snuella sedimenti]